MVLVAVEVPVTVEVVSVRVAVEKRVLVAVE